MSDTIWIEPAPATEEETTTWFSLSDLQEAMRNVEMYLTYDPAWPDIIHGPLYAECLAFATRITAKQKTKPDLNLDIPF